MLGPSNGTRYKRKGSSYKQKGISYTQKGKRYKQKGTRYKHPTAGCTSGGALKGICLQVAGVW